MNTKRNTVSWGSFLGWLIATLFAVVVGFAVFFIVMSILGESIGVIPDLVASLLMAGCFGIVIGLAQWAILRRYVQRSAAWIGVTLLGFLISSPVLLSMGGGFGPYITLRASLIMAASLGGSLGVTQWFVMYKKVRRSALWIGISLISWILAGLIGVFLKTLSLEMGSILYWLGLFFTGTVLSVIGMLWLVKQPNLPTNNTPAG
jgi:hypothetical protein